jgi:antitoxin (DNA-binding transcriptional repressor) of toxin-antitoxin stability system
MNTITAKELRDNLGSIAKRVESGEHIYVSYRNKLSFKLEPAGEVTPARKPLAGLQAFLKAPKTELTERYKTGNLKELYAADMAEKYGIKQ